MKPTAEQLAKALVSTTDRYFSGYMTPRTFRTHVRALWAQVEDAGLQERVVIRILTGGVDVAAR